jgi:hypothetical protein
LEDEAAIDGEAAGGVDVDLSRLFLCFLLPMVVYRISDGWREEKRERKIMRSNVSSRMDGITIDSDMYKS